MLFNVETNAGTPIHTRQIKLVPFAQAVQIKIPALNTRLVWNRPTSLLAAFPDGSEQVIPVHDMTRRIQFSLIGLAIGWALFLELAGRKKRRSRNGR